MASEQSKNSLIKNKYKLPPKHELLYEGAGNLTLWGLRLYQVQTNDSRTITEVKSGQYIIGWPVVGNSECGILVNGSELLMWEKKTEFHFSLNFLYSFTRKYHWRRHESTSPTSYGIISKTFINNHYYLKTRLKL